MAKLIDAWDAAEALHKEFGIQVGKIANVFMKMPSAYPAKGAWTEKNNVVDASDPYGIFRRRWYCNVCGGWNSYGATKFCPNCGAKMIRGKDEESDSRTD